MPVPNLLYLYGLSMPKKIVEPSDSLGLLHLLAPGSDSDEDGAYVRINSESD
jgi:hypothetical protein